MQAARVFPNVIGKNWQEAEQMLLSAGVPKENISKQNLGPAPKEAWTYLVRSQEPAANTPLNYNTRVVLMIYDKPQQGANVTPASGTQQRVGKASQ